MELAELIEKYLEAKATLDMLKSNCGHSWGYYLHNEAESVVSLSKQIDAKVIELTTKANRPESEV